MSLSPGFGSNRNNEMMEVVNVESNGEAEQQNPEPLANGTETQQQKGENFIGRQLKKKFGRKVYTGTVAEFEAETNWYKVVYEDGDGEELEWGELEPLLVPANETKKRRVGAPAKSGSKKRKTKALEEVAKEEQEQQGEESLKKNEAGDEEASELATENEEEPVEKSPKPGKKRGRKPGGKKTQEKPEVTRKRARQAETTTPRKSTRLTNTPVSGVVSTSKKNKKAVTPSAAAKGKRVAKALAATPAVAEMKSPGEAERGDKLRGRRIEKEFDGKMYAGEIRNYDRSRRYYKIHYEDGDEEELVWKEVEPLLLPGEEEQRHGGASTSSATQLQNIKNKNKSQNAAGKKKTVITETVRKTKVVHTKKVVTRSDQKKRRQR